MITPNHRSYRDPAARVVKKQDGWHRYIFAAYQKEYDHLMGSGLYAELTGPGLMISHREVEPGSSEPGVYKELYPVQIAFQSYPYEWSYFQWQKALIAFLDINTIALKHGMILKDATPFNFCLKGGKAVLLDTSSFTFFVQNDPWKAYHQFCGEFLGPFALMHFNGARWAALTAAGTRGLPLTFISKQLGRASWLNLTCLVHIHWHAKFTGGSGGKTGQRGFTAEKLLSLLSLLRSSVSGWKKPYAFKDHWPAYYGLDMESYLAAKEKTLENWLLQTKPKTAIDLGANTGRFSLVAAKYAEYVIALDLDEACIDGLEKEIEKSSQNNITALVGDLAGPTPASGLLNKEYASIFTRGRSDMAIGLALVHHLCIGLNIPLSLVAEMFARFADRFVIAEFVPREDERVIQLLANRDDHFTDYDEENFVKAFSAYFDLVDQQAIGNSARKLFLWKKK